MITDTQKVLEHLLDLLDVLGVQDVLWEGDLDAACSIAKNKIAELRFVQHDTCINELLAKIHGDENYLATHGLEKSCKDAESVYDSLRLDVAALQESHDILVHSEDPW